MTDEISVTQAEFSQSRNDMYWKHYDRDDGFVRWIGYDDANWWDNVAPTKSARMRVGLTSGRVYTIDFFTSEVTITDDPVVNTKENEK